MTIKQGFEIILKYIYYPFYFKKERLERNHMQSILALLLLKLVIFISESHGRSVGNSRGSMQYICDEQDARKIVQHRDCLNLASKNLEPIINYLNVGDVDGAVGIVRQNAMHCSPKNVDFKNGCCSLSISTQNDCDEINRISDELNEKYGPQIEALPGEVQERFETALIKLDQ